MITLKRADYLYYSRTVWDSFHPTWKAKNIIADNYDSLLLQIPRVAFTALALIVDLAIIVPVIRFGFNAFVIDPYNAKIKKRLGIVAISTVALSVIKYCGCIKYFIRPTICFSLSTAGTAYKLFKNSCIDFYNNISVLVKGCLTL